MRVRIGAFWGVVYNVDSLGGFWVTWDDGCSVEGPFALTDFDERKEVTTSC